MKLRQQLCVGERVGCLLPGWNAWQRSSTALALVDQAKIHACNGKNIADMSFLNFTIDKLPSKAVCPTPEIYPGSTLYREEIYGQLPAGLSIRPPTPCPWSIRSTVDQNKLHFDVPKTRSTNVRVNGDTLNLQGSAAFNTWTSGRKGAPVAWLDAPKDETYTFEVDYRLVRRGDKLTAFVSVYDGPDDANNSPFTFGPRTWGEMASALRTLEASTSVKMRIQGLEKIHSCGTVFELSTARALFPTLSIGVSMAVIGSKSAVG